MPSQTEKRERILLLLRSYRDARETLQSGDSGGVSGEHGDRLLLMPNVWRRGSYGELEVCLAELRVKSPRAFRHLRDRYLNGERVKLYRAYKRTGRGEIDIRLRPNEEIVCPPVLPLKRPKGYEPGQEDWLDLRDDLAMVVVHRWDKTVDPRVVSLAVDWLTQRFRGWPRLPGELEEAA